MILCFIINYINCILYQTKNNLNFFIRMFVLTKQNASLLMKSSLLLSIKLFQLLANWLFYLLVKQVYGGPLRYLSSLTLLIQLIQFHLLNDEANLSV